MRIHNEYNNNVNTISNSVTSPRPSKRLVLKLAVSMLQVAAGILTKLIVLLLSLTNFGLNRCRDALGT